MKIIKLFQALVDKLVPESVKDDLDKQQLSRINVYISFLLIFVWLPFFFLVGDTRVALVGLIALLFCLLLPPLVRLTGSVFWCVNIFIAFVTLANFLRTYLCGGSEAALHRWSVLSPVLAALLIGNMCSVFWMTVTIIGYWSFYYLEKIAYLFPGSPELKSTVSSLEMAAFSLISTAIFLTIASLFLEYYKKIAFKMQHEQAEKSKILANNLKEIVLEIRNNVLRLHDSSKNLSKKSKEMKAGVEDIVRRESDLATSVVDSTNTIQQMSSSLKDTVTRITDLKDSIESIAEKRSAGVNNIGESKKALSKIEDSNSDIELMLQQVAEIADSAHLFSLNAAIEAAKAGDYGKGFMVVVDSIRDLALKSSDVVVQIRRINKRNSLMIQQGKNTIGLSEDIFNIISALLGDIIAQVQTIALSIEKQSDRISGIVESAEKNASASQRNSILGKGLFQSVENNDKTIENLDHIAEQLEQKVLQYDVQ